MESVLILRTAKWSFSMTCTCLGQKSAHNFQNFRTMNSFLITVKEFVIPKTFRSLILQKSKVSVGSAIYNMTLEHVLVLVKDFVEAETICINCCSSCFCKKYPRKSKKRQRNNSGSCNQKVNIDFTTLDRFKHQFLLLKYIGRIKTWRKLQGMCHSSLIPFSAATLYICIRWYHL